MDEWSISVEEAAKIMGKSKDFIFLGNPERIHQRDCDTK